MKRIIRTSLFFFAVNFLISTTSFSAVPVLTAVGQDATGTQPPLIASSVDGSGGNWAVNAIPALPTKGKLVDASCASNGTSAICTAAGSSGSSVPLLAFSPDGSNTWAVANVVGAPKTGQYNSTSCSGTDSTAICTAAGQYGAGKLPPLLAVSTNAGNTWAVKSVSGAPAKGSFDSTSCTGSGATGICTAAGENLVTNSPLLAVSTDGANTWSVKTVLGVSGNGYFTSTSCTGTGTTAVCAAAGYGGGTIQPLIAVSTNGGSTWATRPIDGVTANGYFDAVSCGNNGTTTTCIAAGRDLTGNKPPFLAVSVDGGNTWEQKTVTGLTTSGSFYSANCFGSICTAAGQDMTGASPPFLAVSLDSGNTWAVNAVNGLPTKGFFNATSCANGSSGSVVCMAAGKDLTGNQPPFLAVSLDGAVTWNVQTISGLTATGAFFGANAAGNSFKVAV